MESEEQQKQEHLPVEQSITSPIATSSSSSFPRLEEPSDAAFVQSSFDPVNLLEVGLQEWRNNALSLQCLTRSHSYIHGHTSAVVADSPRSSLHVPNYRDATRRWQESYQAANSNPQQDTGKELASQFLSTDLFRRASSVVMHNHGSRREGPGPAESGMAPDHLQDYASSLAAAPHASLIHLIILYHQALSSHGLVDEAQKIAGLLEGLREVGQTEMDADLQGIDLLLKDGLLELYLRIQPYLPPLSSQIVKFKSLTYARDILITDGGYDTVLTKALGCIQDPLGRKTRPQKITLIKDATGYLMPGTLTLVLGPPASGKSSLHHVLSGQIPEGASLEGTRTYNNEDINDIQIHRLSAMVGHLDIHIPLLTVRETLEFARNCTSAFKPRHFGPELKEIMGDALSIGQDPKIEINLSMMGLKHVASRLVGSPLIPSITEDERHRLTAAEMFTGSYPVYFFDQLNRVVEDSILCDLITSIRIFTRVRQITVMVSLLQPSSEIFSLFDRLIVLDQGHIVYQGPRQDALSYFEGLGYKKPKHLGVGEFLEVVTTSEGVVFLQPGFKRLELGDFVSLYKASNMFKDICRVVECPELLQQIWVQGVHPLGLKFEIRDEESSSYFVSGVSDKDGSLLNVSMEHTTNVQLGDKVVAVGSSTGPLHCRDSNGFPKPQDGNLQSAFAEVSEPVRLQLERQYKGIERVLTKQFSSNYVLGWKSEVLLLTNREIKFTLRNKFGLFVRLFQVLVLSLFVGFLLFRVKNDPEQGNMNLFRTAFFVSLMNMTTFNVSQLPALMEERDVYYKQQRAFFFRPGSYLLGKIFGSLPFSLCEGTIWTVIVYFLTGMSVTNGGWHFFVYYVIILLTVLHGASMVRFFSFFAPDRDAAGVFIGLAIAVFLLFAGYLLPHFKVPKYWIWMYHIDPLQWAITALVINEYNSAAYHQLCKDVPSLANIPQCIGRPNDTVGHAYLTAGQFYTNNHWIAISVAILCAWILIWNILAYFSLSKIRHAKVLRAQNQINSENKINAEDLQLEEEVENAIHVLSYIPVPVTLSWHELCYDVMIPSIGKPRTILNYVSGWGEPSDMVALLGSGGAGKTTLLNCLAGRKVLKEHIGGQILVNSYPKVQKDFGHIMGYVDKIDAYTPYMTIRETVAYSAAMRLGKMSSKQKQQEFVEEVLKLTRLKCVEDALVVSLTNDVTFDEEKRLAIATELAANPSILFLDDPTKGLDGSSAVHIIKCLQRIASTGRLVIASLKNPSQRILAAFTKVQILRSGESVYFGPVGKDGEMIKTYFEAIPGTPSCLPNKSICSFVIDVIGDPATHRKVVTDYAFEYRVSELALRNHVHLQHLRRSKGQNGPEIQRQGYDAKFTSMLIDIIINLQRQYWRNVSYSWGRMIRYLIMSILFGSVYFKIEYRTTAGMNSRAGAIFISCILVGLTNAQNVIPQVAQMRAVYQRERAVHQFSAFLYNIAWTLAEVPYLMVANLIFCSILLPMANLAVDRAAQFFMYWFISLEFYVVITFLGMLLAVMSPRPQIASVLVPIIVGIWVSTGGLVVPEKKILRQFIWIFWTNPIQYALHGLTSLAFFCEVNKSTCLNNGRNPRCAGQQSACPQCDCPRLTDANNVFVWTQIASNRSLDYDGIPYDMVALALFAVIFRLLTLLALKFMKHNRST